VSMLGAAGLETRALSQSCIDDLHKQCAARGWDEDVSVTMTVASKHGTEVEVLVRAVERVGPEPPE
jgi:hypothetical protein